MKDYSMEKFLTVDQVADLIGLHKISIWRLVRTKQFPAPIRFTRGCSRWAVSELNNFIAEKMEAKN
jgi:predicted DNA-binding transcriptional regulator AlpA